MIEITLRKKHFGNDFTDSKGCPLAKAMQDHHHRRDIHVGTSSVGLSNADDSFFGEVLGTVEPQYDKSLFDIDVKKVELLTDPEAEVRKLIFTPVPDNV